MHLLSLGEDVKKEVDKVRDHAVLFWEVWLGMGVNIRIVVLELTALSRCILYLLCVRDCCWDVYLVTFIESERCQCRGSPMSGPAVVWLSVQHHWSLRWYVHGHKGNDVFLAIS